MGLATKKMKQSIKLESALALGALGVVFGDIGTSPLYAFKIILGPLGRGLTLNTATVHGVISLIFWVIMLVVSIKYLAFVMRAGNRGEGGIMALVALVRHSGLAKKCYLIILGLFGVALFYGDSVITPAISVLSAVEGLKVITPSLASVVLPVTVAVLALLFYFQKYGSGAIGKLFGPVMLVWFAAIAAAGAWQVALHPGILVSLSPWPALEFIGNHPAGAFIAMGAVVLAVTGAEALYADMGHFGRGAIARSWAFVVLPALALCYLGQGALLINHSGAAFNPFFELFPSFLFVPVVILATLATLIASQAVIAGAFSLTRQAIHLNFLPRLTVRQTSEHERGQIYMPLVNFLLFVLVILLVLLFGSSARLAATYGLAVSGTFLTDSLLFASVASSFWRRGRPVVWLACAVFIAVDLILIATNVPKIIHGAWVPLAIAAAVLLVINTWVKGHNVVTNERRKLERPLAEFISELASSRPALTRMPGQAVYIGHHEGLTPLALLATVNETRELAEKVVVVYVKTLALAHVAEDERASFSEVGRNSGICQVTLAYGFHDAPNVPRALAELKPLASEFHFDWQRAAYFVSLSHVVKARRHDFAAWRQSLYGLMYRNATSSSDYYHLPIERTVEVSSLIKL